MSEIAVDDPAWQRSWSWTRLQPFRLFPLLHLKETKRGRTPVPAAVPPASFLSGGRDGVGEGGGLGKRRADVHRVARSRVCLPAMVVGGARFSRRDVPLWLVFRDGVDEAKAAASLGNVVSRLLPRSGGASLRRRRWSRGVLSWRSGLELLRLGQVMLLLVSYFFKGTEHA